MDLEQIVGKLLGLHYKRNQAAIYYLPCTAHADVSAWQLQLAMPNYRA